MITFDGPSGVGKTTLAKMTAKFLGLPFVDYDYGKLPIKMDYGTDGNVIITIARVIAHLRGNPSNLVLDQCFYALIMWMFERDNEDVEWLVWLFNDVIIEELGAPPVKSFYLCCPRKVVYGRLLDRDGENVSHNFFENDYETRKENAIFRAVEYLCNTLDYFVRVDASKSPDSVFNQITVHLR